LTGFGRQRLRRLDVAKVDALAVPLRGVSLSNAPRENALEC